MAGPSPFADRTPPAVAVLSEDSLVRAGVAQLLAEQGLSTVPENEAAVAVVDCATVRARVLARLPIPYVALVHDDARPTEVLASGAGAVLPRVVDGARLAAAVTAVALGLLVLDGDLGRRALPAAALDEDEPEELTPRELEVLGLVAAGLSNRRIATRLTISEHTAKFHVNSILGKLGVATRTEAVVVAARRGLLWL